MASTPTPSQYIVQAARHFSMPVEKVAALEAAIRPDYPGDEMMIELRLIRTLSAVREGAISIEGAIEEFTAGRTAA